MRIKIALRNLLISQLIIFAFLIFAYFTWFPYSYAKLGGFYDTALMLIFVDLVLGPLLVFIVYNEDKKHLKFDINVLLAIQLAAFIFGAYSLYLKHPAYLVFNNGHFKLVNSSYIDNDNIRFDNLKSNYLSKPKMALVEMPTNSDERLGIMMGIDLFGERDIDERPEYYKPYQKHIHKILSKQLHPKQVFKDQLSKNTLDALLLKHGGNVADYAFFPITGNDKKAAILVLTQTEAKPVGIIEAVR